MDAGANEIDAMMKVAQWSAERATVLASGFVLLNLQVS